VPVHTGNFVAIFCYKLLPETATNCCRKRQQIVAENGNNSLPFSATICCWFVAVFLNNLLPVWTGLIKGTGYLYSAVKQDVALRPGSYIKNNSLRFMFTPKLL